MVPCAGTTGWGYQIRQVRSTGGVLYTVYVTAVTPTLRFAPPILCFATPTFVKWIDFLALYWWYLTLAMQNCHICRHFDIQALVCYHSTAEHPVSKAFCPLICSEKLNPWRDQRLQSPNHSCWVRYRDVMWGKGKDFHRPARAYVKSRDKFEYGLTTTDLFYKRCKDLFQLISKSRLIERIWKDETVSIYIQAVLSNGSLQKEGDGMPNMVLPNANRIKNDDTSY